MLNLRGILLRPPLQDADDTTIANMSALVFSDYPQDATATVPSTMEEAEGPEVESYRLEYMQASMMQNLRNVGIQKYWQPNSSLTQVRIEGQVAAPFITSSNGAGVSNLRYVNKNLALSC
jgi:hypothetical protein